MDQSEPDLSRGPMCLVTFNRVSYVDGDGYRIGWVYRRLGEGYPIESPNSIRGHWDFVDDDYPNNVNDALQELIEKIPPPDAPRGPMSEEPGTS